VSKTVYQDVMQLDVAPEQVREFIMTAERIADNFPNVIDYGTFETGKRIWCSGKSGVSLLELIEEESTDKKLTMTVVSANTVKPPYTAEAIRAKPLVTMVEDWEIEANAGGTRLTKSWRKVEKHKMKWLPMKLLIRLTARAEHQKLIDGWNKAATEAVS
jgi:hypothetical protein